MRLGPLSIAGVTHSLSVHGQLDEEAFFARFGHYLTSEQSAPSDARLRVFLDPHGKLIESADVPYPGMKAFHTPGGVKLLRAGLSLWVSDTLVAEAHIKGPDRLIKSADETDAGPLDTPLRILTSLALLRSGRGALMHASGFADAERGLLFIGESGAGKTTLSTLLPEATVLSDDQVALLCADAGLRVASTPFVGMFGKVIPPRSAPLRAIVALDRTRLGTVEPVPQQERAPSLLRCLPLYSRTSHDALAALDLVSRITSSVPMLRGSPALSQGAAPWLAAIDAACPRL